MSNLNSVLIEGMLAAKPVYIPYQNEKACSFTMVSKRHYREHGETGKIRVEKIGVTIEVEQPKLMAACMERGKKGSGARVVGRLKEAPCGDECRTLVVVAEHVEFRPAQ